jgi:hypothetical protein
MSPIIKKFFTAALIYLVLGLLAQAISILDAGLGFNPLAYTATAATQQILLLGWLTQLGLALIYDRWLTLTEVSNRKSSSIVFALFNIGLPLVIIGQPGLALVGGAWLGIVAVGGGVLLLAAGLIFIRQAWLTLRN